LRKARPQALRRTAILICTEVGMNHTATKANAEVVDEAGFDDYDEELEAAAARAEKHPDFQHLASTPESLQRDMADYRAGLIAGRPWREVKADGDALRS
jgi:hypothetical protein